ncbi:SusC/RagA family TonB-linked outer membrane protein [Fulvivirga sp. M361]|nr:SusC/RagA family TonB-linked outer membrane protein [Fulvivirga sp. M361]
MLESLSPVKIILQDKVVTGTVTSQEDGIPLPGVNVLVKGTALGTITDIDGSYSISVPNTANVLIFSYIGYSREEVNIEGKSVINIAMITDVQQLSEIVVTALGFEEEKDRLGYTSSKVEGPQLVKSGEGNVINGMAGKASGVRITRSAGDPGAGSHIQIRGASTIDRGIQPLIVVDGIPISNASGSGTGGVLQQSRLNDINPDDIARMDVLKGSSAAALWGTRAANGVIIITTKKGQAKDKVDIAFRSTFSVDKILDRHDLQTTFGQGSNGSFVQDDRRSWGDKISDREGGDDLVDEFGPSFVAQDGTEYYNIIQKRSRNIFTESNYDAVFQDGHYWDNSLSISGGDEKSNFFFSLSDFEQQGVVRNNSDYRRSTLRLNAERRFNDVVKIRSNTTYIRTQSNRIRRGNSSSGLLIPLLRTPPDFDNSDFIGDYFAFPGASPVRDRQRANRNPIGASSNPRTNNPLWSINRQINEANVNRIITSAQINITPTKWLDIVLRGGVDSFTERRTGFFFPSSAGTDNSTGAFNDEIRQDLEFNTDAMVIVKPKLNKAFSTEILTGFNLNNRRFFDAGGGINNFILPIELRDFSNAQVENTTLSDFENINRTAAWYNSVNVDYKGLLFVSLTGRFESASTFGEEADNSFFYPSATVAWQLSQLPALRGSRIFSFAKMRMAYAEVGVQPRSFRTTSVYVAPNYSDPFGGNLNSSTFGNGVFVPSSTIGNAELKPERKREIELGTDLRFFDHKLKASVTHYRNKISDILFNVEIPRSAGYDQIYDNAGNMENRGWEVELSYDIINKQNFSWSAGVLWDRNRNEVTSLIGGTETINLGGLGGVSSRAVEGFQHGVLWGARWARNDDGSIRLDENGFPQVAATDGVIGDPNPDWRGSAFTNISFKGFTLNVLFETFQGADIAAGTRGVLQDHGLTLNTANESVAPRDLLTFSGGVIPAGASFRGNIENFGAGDVALTESWYKGSGGFFNGSFEQFIEDGSWTRLREISLSYTLSSEKFRKLTKLQSIELSATGRNLVIWSAFKGNDPDTNLTGVSSARGIDYFNTPGTRSYIFTLKIKY